MPRVRRCLRRAESSGRAADGEGDEVVDEDGAEQEEDEDLVPGGVEDDRHDGQPGDDRAAAVAAEQVEARMVMGRKRKRNRRELKSIRAVLACRYWL